MEPWDRGHLARLKIYADLNARFHILGFSPPEKTTWHLFQQDAYVAGEDV